MTLSPTFFSDEEKVVDQILSEIESILKVKEYFKLCLSGGNSIRKTMQLLSTKALPWEKIVIYQTDERVIALNSEHSNFYWISSFFSDKGAILKPFYNGTSELDSLDLYNQYLNTYGVGGNFGFDLMILPFGEDGHIASLFSDCLNRNLLDSTIHIEEKKNGYSRLSLNISILKSSTKTILLSYGQKKRNLIQKELKPRHPIYSFLKGQKGVLWYHKD